MFLVKKIVKLFLLFIFVSASSAVAATIDENLKSYLSNKYLFKDATPLVREINFFWTSGRKLKDVKKYTDPTKRKYLKRDNMVYIGGSENLAKEFSEAVNSMLKWGAQFHKGKIQARLVVDKLTYQTNKRFIKNLEKSYPQSFKVVYIDRFKKQLKDSLSNDSWGRAKIVFGNADAGNPAIASDIYRLIFPTVKSNDELSKKIFIYADVDSFVDFAKSDYKKGLDSVIRLKYDANQYNTRNDIGRYLYSTNKLERRAFANKNAVLFSKSGANDIVVIKVTDAASYVLKVFGANNPAHKQIVSILRKSNPFQTDKFRSFIKTTIEDEEDLNLFIEDLKEQYQKNKYIIAKILHELEKHGIKYDIVKLILGDNPKEMLTTQTTSSSH